MYEADTQNYRDRGPRLPKQQGHVYILNNQAMPGLVKIGHTARTPEIRAAELSAATGVPGRFVVAWSHPVRDHEALEALAHGRLARYRVNNNREFFSCTVAQARRIIKQEARAQLLPWWLIILHRLVHRLPPPRRSPARMSTPWKRRRQGDLFNFYALMLGTLVIGLLIHFRPVMPAWMPSSITSAAYALERLHP
jgi:hypothetical protein